MTARYCLKYELGLCPRTGNSEIPPPFPWFLVDDEGRRLRLQFHCDERHCTMEVLYKG
jgi:hypothetical protein